MYTWVLDYFYNGVIILGFIVFPFITYYIVNKKMVSWGKLKSYLLSFLIFCIVCTLVFIVKDLHIETIEKICFDYPIMTYKDDAPQACYNFDATKYQGVGWTLKVIFWSILYLLYLSMVIGAIAIYDKYKRDSGKDK